MTLEGGTLDDGGHAARRPGWPGPGDTVLLAPAAASMDMFRDYAHRGDAFADAVRGPRRAGSWGTGRPRPRRPGRPHRARVATDRPRPHRGPLAWLDGPLTSSYHLVLGARRLLLALGLVMVFSASSVVSYAGPRAGSRRRRAAGRYGR